MLAACTLPPTSVALAAQRDTPSVRLDTPADGLRSVRPGIVPGARGEALHGVFEEGVPGGRSEGVPGARSVGVPVDAPADRSVRHTRLRLATGVELHVAEAGPIDGMPVLFLHGYTDSWFSWSPMLERLPGGIRAIVPTQRGHGDSDRPACCYGLADFAADAVALLDTLGIDRAAVVGHSMGSFVAQLIAIDRPDRVTRLVLIGSGSIGRVDPVVELYDAVRTLTDPVDPAFIRAFQESTAANPLPSEFLDRVIVESGKLPARVWHDVISSLIQADASDELHRIETPTLLLWGDRDAVFVRRDQDALLEAIPGSRLIVYPGVGHAPNWEWPDRVAADLEGFLRALRGGSRPSLGPNPPSAAPRPSAGGY